MQQCRIQRAAGREVDAEELVAMLVDGASCKVLLARYLHRYPATVICGHGAARTWKWGRGTILGGGGWWLERTANTRVSWWAAATV